MIAQTSFEAEPGERDRKAETEGGGGEKESAQSGKSYRIMCPSSERWNGILKAAAKQVPVCSSLWLPTAG